MTADKPRWQAMPCISAGHSAIDSREWDAGIYHDTHLTCIVSSMSYDSHWVE